MVASATVGVSWGFTNRREFLGRMVNRADERAFDVYLYLLKEYNGNRDAEVTVNHEKLAESLGIKREAREAYRREILRVLRKLKSIYGLIDAATGRGGDSRVILKDYAHPKRSYRPSGGKFLNLSVNYWKYGWNRRLKFSAKVMYLLNLAYAAVSPRAPEWFSTVATLSKRHGLSGWFISDGTTALRRAAQVIRLKNPDNPKRSMNYLMGTAENLK